MKYVNQPVRKKDAMQLVTGQPVYVDDIAPKDCLIVKLLRSPYANAMVTSVNKAAAMKVDGIEAIYTWEDIPQDGRRYLSLIHIYCETLDQRNCQQLRNSHRNHCGIYCGICYEPCLLYTSPASYYLRRMRNQWKRGVRRP